MNTDQQLQLWNVIGTWFAGIATAAAVIVSLWLATRHDRVKLRVYAGVRLFIRGDGSAPREFVAINATNIGERPATITSVGWRVGRGKERRHCLQTLGDPESHDYPKRLEHGEIASFLVFTGRGWPADFMNGFVQSNDPRYLKTLVAQVHTSLGQSVDCKPEANLIELLAKHYDPRLVVARRKRDADAEAERVK